MYINLRTYKEAICDPNIITENLQSYLVYTCAENCRLPIDKFNVAKTNSLFINRNVTQTE